MNMTSTRTRCWKTQPVYLDNDTTHGWLDQVYVSCYVRFPTLMSTTIMFLQQGVYLIKFHIWVKDDDRLIIGCEFDA
ncbi:MAG TPA: hypothetical protein DCG78_01855 [Anaerolineaceae bacterium]|nr:hypothetical protein [Anaerolineaceae bacterium]